jgi:transcriptional regulator with XRE-family HTH domain
MFKTEEQINSRLNSERNLVNRFGTPNVVGDYEWKNDQSAPLNNVTIIPLQQPGNKEKPKLDSEEKNEIAFRARAGETQVSLAAEFGVSQSAIGEIEQGRTKVDEIVVQSRLDQVQDVAMTKLLESLGYITSDKMDKCKATDLSSIAANMSKVVSNVRGKSNETGPIVNVNVYAPELRNERTFKTIEV